MKNNLSLDKPRSSYVFVPNLEDHRNQGPEWIKAAKNLLRAQELRKMYEEKEEECRRKLVEMSGGVRSKGDCFTFTPTYYRGLINYDLLPDYFKSQLERYRMDNEEGWILTYEIKSKRRNNDR